MKYYLAYILFLITLLSCMKPVERDCKAHKDGTYSFTMILDKDSVSTTFTRKGNLEIDRFNGKIDSSSVRWINDCEYVLKNLNPKNREEEKAIHIKILSTTDSSYTFEFSAVGETNKLRGTAIKTH
ncbi:DNA topoisomerase IV [Flavobacterium sp. ASW18X]|uniref:DNA topoisomerase IV n=1 Tax=Flavobacterium sp. ASW18X TaxID=2572595 RepID=UPI0010AE6D65|nr:DNA topoisomerase IV [Flavobacterium sp. ASW18X]TKD66139.1 DNA topoisomerase IV [Flavobacterium sp. ASW18X]